MARQDPYDETGHRTPGVDDSISAATRALADATATLTRLLGKQAQSVVPEVSEALAAGLREASRGLADASENVARRGGDHRARENRREKVDRTRADLLDAASRVIAAQGYEGASVGDIAAEAGYTKGALYAHFGSKSGLFLALARERLGIAMDDPALDMPGLTDDGVDTEALADWIRATQDDPNLLLSLEFLSYGLRNPGEAGELVELHVRSFETATAQAVRIRQARRRAAGEDPGPDEPTQQDRDLTLAIISVLNVVTLEGKLTGSPHMSPEAGARIIARLVADG
ncbi:TetR/AcrR family transcriptional regulator [Cellulomonas sp. ES6]|uniref:TetR/AcrR family transcriptional regulator n=1 Tax=Cellulomonas sp. ES6 TaxID=3039384 RepID=UPI0019B97526|nr:TetR/AcrR family transcriptional regulator [Cellulomonas sp. ES6]MBD3780017.1 TetR/AcrR family transcriptional regulator [Micrococcales bacterium]WHP17328.1 helix-turn-helix domain-containing protein [Cellulomonas sp. ES6]